MLNFPFLKKLKRRKIQFAFKEDIEPHEILLDSLARKKEKEFGLSEKKFEIPLLRKIIQGFFLFCFLLICFLFFKIKGGAQIELCSRFICVEELRLLFSQFYSLRNLSGTEIFKATGTIFLIVPKKYQLILKH